MCIKYLDKKKRVLFKSKLEQMEIVYHNNEAKRIYQEVNSIRKGFKPQTLLIRDKVGDIVSNKEKVLQIWSEYYKKHFELQDRMDDNSGEEWTMCVQTTEPYVVPPNDAEIDGNK